MTIDPISIPIIQEALEMRRQQMDKELGQRVAHLKNHIHTLTPSEVANDMQSIINANRNLGALDAICALYGITNAVMGKEAVDT